MRQTSHDKHMYEIDIIDGKGLVVLGKTIYRREDIVLPEKVIKKMKEKEKSIE